MNKIISFHHGIIIPQPSLDEIKSRKLRIFHILLMGSLYLVGTATIITIVNYLLSTIIYQQHFTGASPIMLASIWLGLASLLWLSKKDYQQPAIYLFLILLWLPAAYTSLRWGALIYQAVIIYALIIILTGILINNYVALGSTILTGIYLIILTTLQYNQKLYVDLSWRQYPEDTYNAIMVAATLCLISLVSWVYNHELQHAFSRAIKSEKDLKNERDSLDRQVKIRTKQLKIIQMEKMMQWQQFVELGRSAAEIFHDIKNPLTSASLNLEQLCEVDRIGNPLSSKKIHDTLQSINYIGQFITATQTQIKPHKTQLLFNPTTQIHQAIQFLSPKALANKVKIDTINHTRVKLYGSPNKFSQIMINLISNSIDAHHMLKTNSQRKVSIKLRRKHQRVMIVVKDSGCGIPLADQPFVFDPLYTTKPIEQGTGLGLNIVKSVVENDFNGSVFFCSQPNSGTTFVVNFPLKTP